MKLEDYKMKIVSFKCNQKYLKVKIKHFKLEMIHLKFFLNKQEKKNQKVAAAENMKSGGGVLA